jgi:(+)-abscisic acid 8'-hydroxylase
MGWPYVGETFQLYSSKNPNVFFARKQNRYGPIFKTHILGCPCVMVSSPEAARFVLVTQAHLFKPTFPASKERMLGPQAIFFQQGDYHAHLRRLVSRAFSPEAIRASVPAIEAIALRSLRSWDGQLVNTFQEMKLVSGYYLLASSCCLPACSSSSALRRALFRNQNQNRNQMLCADCLVPLQYALNVALLSIFGEEEMRYIEELKQCYLTLEKGYNSMPVNLPGTLFHKAMKARKRLGDIVAHIISARRERRQRGSDLLASFLDDREALTDAQIADNVIGVIFAARDTTASVLTWMVKFLGDHPSVLKAVIVSVHSSIHPIHRKQATSGLMLNESPTQPSQDEQEEIARSKCSPDAPLTWADTRRMRMTSRVIQETMRVASILSFTFREAVEDVEYQGEDATSLARSLTSLAVKQAPPAVISRPGSAPRLLTSLSPSCAAADELDGRDGFLTENE